MGFSLSMFTTANQLLAAPGDTAYIPSTVESETEQLEFKAHFKKSRAIGWRNGSAVKAT